MRFEVDKMNIKPQTLKHQNHELTFFTKNNCFFGRLVISCNLFIAMPIKYLYDKPEAVKHTGMAHGVLFVAYLVLLFIVHVEHKWKLSQTFWAFVASLVPFGTFYADKKWFRTN